MSFRKDFNDANASFEKFKGRITHHMRGEIRDIETNDEELARMFDMYSGIDAVHIYEGQMRGVAIRCQWGVNFQTFTVRFSRRNGADTEYKKRVTAIYGGKGYFYPYLTIQTYFDNREDPDHILSFGIVKTEDLYAYIIQNMPTIKRKTCPEGNQFLIVPFAELKSARCNIIVERTSAASAPAIMPIAKSVMQPQLGGD